MRTIICVLLLLTSSLSFADDSYSYYDEYDAYYDQSHEAYLADNSYDEPSASAVGTHMGIRTGLMLGVGCAAVAGVVAVILNWSNGSSTQHSH